jgi:hypothetical protein
MKTCQQDPELAPQGDHDTSFQVSPLYQDMQNISTCQPQLLPTHKVLTFAGRTDYLWMLSKAMSMSEISCSLSTNSQSEFKDNQLPISHPIRITE